MECNLLMSVSAYIKRQNKKFIIGFKLIKYPYILCTIIYMLAYTLYFNLERKMIIVGLHIITSRHVFNIHISTFKVCILLGAYPSKHDTANSESTLEGFEFQKFSHTIELTLWQFMCDCTPAVLPHCSQRDAYKA